MIELRNNETVEVLVIDFIICASMQVFNVPH